MEKLRFLIVDDDKDFRTALRMFLDSRPHWEVVGEAENGWEGVEKAQLLRPDLTIMDLNMPEFNGVAATREITRTLPGSAVMVLTEHNSMPLVCEALEAGAKGFLPKSDIDQLVDIVTATLAS